MFLGHDLGWWVDKANGVYIAALALTVVLSGFVIYGQRQIAAEKDLEIAALHEKATANALETERLKERLQWRELTTKQKENLISAFSKFKADHPLLNINVFYYEPDSEVKNFASQLIDAMRDTAYPLEGHPSANYENMGMGEIPQVGVFIADEPKGAAEELRQAFEAGGVDALLKPNSNRARPDAVTVEVWRRRAPEK